MTEQSTEQEAGRERAALAKIRSVVGTSTEAWHIANDALAAAPREQEPEHHPGCHQWSADEWVCQPECPHFRTPEPPAPGETREPAMTPRALLARAFQLTLHSPDAGVQEANDIIADVLDPMYRAAPTGEAARLADELDNIATAWWGSTHANIAPEKLRTAAHLLRTLERGSEPDTLTREDR